MGLAFLFLFAAAVFAGAVWWARPARRPGVLLLAALLVGGTGYVAQGSPFLKGSPTPPRANHPAGDPLFAAERGIWLGKVGAEADLLASADRLIADGSPDYAVGILRGAVARTPRSMDLWLGLGNALATYADGAVTPPARFAFMRAAELAPRHPAPPYFLGLAYAANGDLDTAEGIWRGLLAASPPDAPYRKLIALRLDMLSRLRGMATAPGG